MVAQSKQITSHKSVHWYQCISLWKMHVHDKENVLLLKIQIFVKNALFSKNNVPDKISFLVNPSPKYVQAYI